MLRISHASNAYVFTLRTDIRRIAAQLLACEAVPVNSPSHRRVTCASDGLRVPMTSLSASAPTTHLDSKLFIPPSTVEKQHQSASQNEYAQMLFNMCSTPQP